MVFTLLPFSAFADAEKPYTEHSETNGVVMDKTVKHVSGDTYKVTLEQYVEGRVTPGKTTPIDVVLVLDVSGSMGKGFSTKSYEATFDTSNHYIDLGYGYYYYYDYYVKNSDESYTKVNWCDECKAFTDGCEWDRRGIHVTGGTKYTPKSSAEDTTNGVVQFYVQKTSSTTKIAALKSAVNSFIDAIKAGNSESQIAIVKFASSAEIVKELTNVSTGADSLKDAVSGLSANGATAADYGLEKAINVFGAAGQVPKDRNRVVIMFTDGEPNYYNGFDSEVADAAIKNAQTLKSKYYGASVYTIGIFDGASVGESLPANKGNGRTNRYMHLVSSNYPNARSMSEIGTDGAVKNGYYKVASDAESLGSVFTKLGEAIGKPSIDLGNTAVLTDNIAPNFNVPKDAKDVKVYTADYDGKSKTFGDREDFTGDVMISGNAVTVTGFDYSANYVSETKHPGTDNDYGKKLIVEFDITVDRNQTYGGTQPANDGAKITLEGKEIASVDYRPVPVSIVNGFSVDYENSKDYDGEGFTIKDEFEAMLKNDNIADGEKNDYVNITYTVIDEKGGIVGTYVIEANKTTGTWTAGSAAAITSPDVGTYNYKVTCVVSDATENGAEPVTKSGPMTLSITEKKGLTVSGTDYNGMYDGKSHGEAATANVDGATIEYSTDGENWTTDVPTVKNVSDSTEVQVRATKTGYVPAEATYNLNVTPRPVTLTSETASKPYDGTPLTRPVVTVTGDGFVLGEVTDIKAIGSVTNVSEGSVTNTIVYTTTEKFVEGNYNITKAEGKLSITPLAVTVTAKDYTKYVGEKDPAFEATVTGTINNDTVSYTISREKGETAGTYSITPAGAEAQGNYTVTYKAGTLTIKERPYRPNPPITDKITVEITGNSDSVVYDGTEHSVKDYTVKISDSRYTEKDFTFSGKALASGVNAGAYEMGLKADQFKNTNARFTNVEFIIKADGVLTITQRPLTITAGSAEGIAPVTCDKYTVEGLATGDKVDSVKITGIQSEPGESPNVASDAVIKNAKGEDVTANYKITYVDGVLKAIEVLNKEIHFNYVIGYTDGTIRPNNNISRAEVATIFFRLLTDEARTQYDKTTSSFSDIKDGAWCCRAVSTLTNMGIIKGYTDGTFQPNKSITRAELATIIARFAKLDVNTKTFSDINGHWAQKSIELAAGNGWINGYTDGTFRPNKSIIRAETFAMINRVLDRQTESVSDLLPTSEMNMWSDNLNENAWYYKDVQEATNYHKCDRVGDSVYEKWTEKVPDIDWASYQI